MFLIIPNEKKFNLPSFALSSDEDFVLGFVNEGMIGFNRTSITGGSKSSSKLFSSDVLLCLLNDDPALPRLLTVPEEDLFGPFFDPLLGPLSTGLLLSLSAWLSA